MTDKQKSKAAKEKKLAAYQAKMRKLLNSADSLDARIMRNTKDLISRLRDKILSRTGEIVARADKNDAEPGWGQYWMSRLIPEYNAAVQEIGQQFERDLSGYTVEGYGNGADLADEGIQVVVPGIDVRNTPKLDIELIKIASSFSAELITRMKAYQIAAISKEVADSLAAGEAGVGLIGRLAKSIDAGPWLSSRYRAEVIARTETARVQELARIQRTEQQQRAFPEIKMYSQFLVAPVHNAKGELWPCTICSKYDGNVYDAAGNLHIQAKGKSDQAKMPVVPIHPNCFIEATQVRIRVRSKKNTAWKYGWRRFKDLSGREEVWALDPETLKPQWVKIRHIVSRELAPDEPLIRFYGPMVDLTVTPGHEMFAGEKHFDRKCRDIKWSKKEAKEMTEQDLHYHGMLGPVSVMRITEESHPAPQIVWCVELVKLHVMLVRSLGRQNHNKATWSSNCRCTFIPWVPELSPHPDEHYEAPQSESEVKVSWEPIVSSWVVKFSSGSIDTVSLPSQIDEESLKKAIKELGARKGYAISEFDIDWPGSYRDDTPAEDRAINWALGGVDGEGSGYTESSEGSAQESEMRLKLYSEAIMLNAAAQLSKRFRSFVREEDVEKGGSDPDQCYTWTGGTDKDGYGAFSFGGSTVRANRMAWMIAHQKNVPEGELVLHKCGNSCCVRSSHLRLGDHEKNAADRERHKSDKKED